MSIILVILFLQLEKGVLNLYLIISTLNVSYTHSKMIKWFSLILDKRKKSQALQIKDLPAKGKLMAFFIFLVCNVVLRANWGLLIGRFLIPQYS